MGVAIVEMGVEEKMALEDQHGGHSHHTSHSTSSNLTTSLHTSWTDTVVIPSSDDIAISIHHSNFVSSRS